jgi:hypothetical protein
MFLILALAAPILYNFGFFGFLGQLGPTQYPSEWVEAEKIIAADPTPSVILMLPPHLYATYSWINSTQKTAGLPASQFFSKPVMTSQNIETKFVFRDVNDTSGDYISYLFSSRPGDPASMLLPLNARYILLSKTSRDWIRYLFSLQGIFGVKNIEKVYEGKDTLLFRNNLVKGPLFASTDNGSGGFGEISPSSLSPDADFRVINPWTYEVLNSSMDNVVFTIPSYFMEFQGTHLRNWHGIAGVFKPEGPGYLVNTLAFWTIALFILSWGVVIILIAGLDTQRLAVVCIASIALFILFYQFLIDHYALGWFLILSFFPAILFRKSGVPVRSGKA